MMEISPRNQRSAQREIRQASGKSGFLFGSALLFSVLVNLLMLTGPLFMLQVYDRVLSSRSEETLMALFVLVAGLYALMALLDYARGRVMARIGARMQERLDSRVFEAEVKLATSSAYRAGTANGLRNLDALQAYYASPVYLALMDVPWTPIFLVAIFIFHPYLGWLAVFGGAFLISLTVINQLITYTKVKEAQTSLERAHAFAAEVREGNEIVQSQGMRSAVLDRWRQKRSEALGQSMFANDWTGSFSSLIKATRLFLQSAMLAVGAWLVLQGELTAGAMIAGSILLGRALAPVQQLMGQWPVLQRARAGRAALTQILAASPQDVRKTQLPVPKPLLAVSGLTVIPPGGTKPTLRNVSFTLEPGHALGVIGLSGSGKSTLAKALLGLWPPAAGQIRLGGPALDQYESDELGRHIGYLPQSVRLFSGTVAENIARMTTNVNGLDVVSASKRANAHDLITALPDGYDTFINGNDTQLSGGQMQRIALARALYGDPVLLILDEPNSALDADGSNAMNESVRDFKATSKSVVIMTHRPAAISECDLLIVLENGAVSAFGPRDKVLKSMVKNAEEVGRSVAKVSTIR